MFWMIVTRFFCKTEILRDFHCTLKAGIFSLKKVFSPFIKRRIWFFYYTRTVEDKARYIWKHFRNNRICCFFTICKSRSGFGEIFCTVFETVYASSLAMCAYQIGEHLHLTFADHLDLQSTIKSQFSVSVRADPTFFWMNNVPPLQYFFK